MAKNEKEEPQREHKVRDSAMPENFQSTLSTFTTQVAQMVVNDLSKTNRTKFIKSYSKQDIRDALKAPKQNEKRLREISNFLFNSSSQYRRLVWYLSQMATFDYILEPSNITDRDMEKPEDLKDKYKQTANRIETMNIKHEFQKIFEVAIREDVFYGYEREANNSYFIQRLDPEFCRITSVVDGMYNFSFNFSYFDHSGNNLDNYPEEFRKLYKEYLSQKSDKNWREKTGLDPRWKELDFKKTVCVKVNQNDYTPIPPLAMVFEDVADIVEYKELKKAKTEIENYKLLIQKIPMRESSTENDDFTIDFDTARKFHQIVSQTLPEGIGLTTTPMEFDEVSFDKQYADVDNVETAERDFWNSAGVSQFLFNSDKSSNAGIEKSVQTDEQLVFNLLRQLERWLNRKIKTKASMNNKFKVSFLETTYFNREKVFEKYLKASQFGVPVKSRLAASLGISPSAMISMASLENDVLNFNENWVPLESSHTQNGSDPTDEGGAPEVDDDELSPEGESTRENGGNEHR